MSIEVFREFPYEIYADRYSVSNQGKIWSKRAKKYLNIEISNKVEIVKLNNFVGRGSTTFQVDKIIADAFLGPSDLFLEHIDGNMLNNKADNLRWVHIEDYLSRKYTGNWKEITLHPGYFVSDKGQVWSTKNNDLRMTQKHGGSLTITIGYPKSKFYLMHQLVAIHFIPNPNNLPFVSHISGDNFDNNVANLEWVSQPKHKSLTKNKRSEPDPEKQTESDSDDFADLYVVLDWLPNYHIFDDGRIYSTHVNRFLLGTVTSYGYKKVSCVVDGVCKKMFVHRLVAEAWLPYMEHEKMEINHKNMIKTDNRVSNLEWVTRSENNIHASENNSEKKKRFQIPVYCLDKDTEEIIARYDGVMDASRDTGTNSGSISKCCKNGRCAGGYKWRHV